MLKGDLRKQAILDVAERLFFSRGYTDTTIQDMLDELDCSKGSFYHHYESKLQVLSALCSRREQLHFEEYQKQVFPDLMSQLNALFYFAMPFREGEDNNISLLLPLEGLSDAGVVYEAIEDAQKQLFYPELCRLLELLRAAGLIYYSQPLLPELLWNAYTVCYRALMHAAHSIKNGGAPGQVIQLLEAERFMWERMLDAPYGSIELIRGNEALQTIDHAVLRLRRRNHQG